MKKSIKIHSNRVKIDSKIVQNRSPEGILAASGGSLAPKVVLGHFWAVFLSLLKRSWAPRAPQEGAKLEPKSMKNQQKMHVEKPLELEASYP